MTDTWTVWRHEGLWQIAVTFRANLTEIAPELLAAVNTVAYEPPPSFGPDAL